MTGETTGGGVQPPPSGETAFKDEKKPGGRAIPFFTVLFPMLTALLTFAGTVAGLWWPTNQDRNDLADEAAALDEQVQDLNVDLEAQQAIEADLDQQVQTQASTITSLQDQLDQRTTDNGPPSPPDSDPTGVYRASGDEPLRFNEGYGVDLDTLDEDWGIGQIFGTLDLYLNSSSEGPRLSTPPGVVVVMDHDASYEECDRATDLQDRLSTEETAVGTRFCTKTNGGRWAFVTIVEVDRVVESIVVDVTVWSPED